MLHQHSKLHCSIGADRLNKLCHLLQSVMIISYRLTFMAFISRPLLLQLDSTYRKAPNKVLFSHVNGCVFLNNMTWSQGGSVATFLEILLPPPKCGDGGNLLI